MDSFLVLRLVWPPFLWLLMAQNTDRPSTLNRPVAVLFLGPLKQERLGDVTCADRAPHVVVQQDAAVSKLHADERASLATHQVGCLSPLGILTLTFLVISPGLSSMGMVLSTVLTKLCTYEVTPPTQWPNWEGRT